MACATLREMEEIVESETDVQYMPIILYSNRYDMSQTIFYVSFQFYMYVHCQTEISPFIKDFAML